MPQLLVLPSISLTIDMVVLLTSDKIQLTADREVVERSVFIRNVLKDARGSDKPIMLHNVSSSVMEKVLDYCEHHRREPLPSADPDQDDPRSRSTEISEWDKKFIAVDQEMLFEIISAANFLDIKPLLDVGCTAVANMIKDKNPDEIVKLFNIITELAPEEEAQSKI